MAYLFDYEKILLSHYDYKIYNKNINNGNNSEFRNVDDIRGNVRPSLVVPVIK